MKVLNKHKDEKTPSDLYIGRGSKWGNPFVIGKDGTRIEVLIKYLDWIESSDELICSLSELKGRNLVCFCAPRPCHGHILKFLYEGKSVESIRKMLVHAKSQNQNAQRQFT